MSAHDPDDVSNAELARMINAGFTGMQDQFNSQQGQINAILEVLREHSAAHQRHDERFEEAAAERSALARKLDATIALTDRHDRVIQRLRK